MPKIVSVNSKIALFQPQKSDLLDKYSDSGEAKILNEFAEKNMGSGKILLIDLSTVKAIHGTPKHGTRGGTGAILPYFDHQFKERGIGCIFFGLSPALEEMLGHLGIKKNITLAETFDDAEAIAEMLNENPKIKAQWVASNDPAHEIELLILQHQLPEVEQINPNTLRLKLPWDRLNNGHLEALENKAKEIAGQERKPGEKRKLVIDISNLEMFPSALFPATLSRIQKLFSRRGEAVCVVDPAGLLQHMCQELPKAPRVPTFETLLEAIDSKGVGSPG